MIQQRYQTYTEQKVTEKKQQSAMGQELAQDVRDSLNKLELESIKSASEPDRDAEE